MNIWNAIVTFTTDLPKIVRERTESLKSCFSGSSLPSTGFLEGEIVYKTDTQTWYGRNASAYEELNSITNNGLFYKNLIIKRVSATTIDINADYVSFGGYTKASLDLTLNTATAGANGLKSGLTFSANTAYFIYLMIDTGSAEPYGSSPTFVSLLSNSPTESPISGYEKIIRIGCIRTLASTAGFRPFIQYGNVLHYTDYAVSYVGTSGTDDGHKVLSGGSVTTFTQITQADMQKLVPYSTTYYPTQIILIGVLTGTTTIKTVLSTVLAPTTGMQILFGTSNGIKLITPIDPTNGLYYIVGNIDNDLDLYVVGYVDNI